MKKATKNLFEMTKVQYINLNNHKPDMNYILCNAPESQIPVVLTQGNAQKRTSNDFHLF